MARAQRRARRAFGRIERLPSGRYRAGYTGPDGQLYRAPMTFDAKDDAIAWLSTRRAEIEMNVWAPEVAARGARRRESPTFRAYADSGTVVRHVGEGQGPAPEAEGLPLAVAVGLRQDGDPIPVLCADVPVIGRPWTLLLAIRDDGVPTIRNTTFVLQVVADPSN